MAATRRLIDLVSVGPAAVRDFQVLGITDVEQLIGKSSMALYNSLCVKTGSRHDPCVIDVFRAAIEQAENTNLEWEKCNWWYWTNIRKKGQRELVH